MIRAEKIRASYVAIASVGENPRPQLDATSPHPCTGSKNTLDHQKQDSCFSTQTLHHGAQSVTTRIHMTQIVGSFVEQVLVTHARKSCSKSCLYNSWSRGQHAVILGLFLMSKCSNVKTPQIARTCGHLQRHPLQ